MIKGIVIGGGVGALVATAQATRGQNDPPDTVAREAAKGAAEGALVGGLIGAVVDWRARRRPPEPGWAEAPAAAVAAAQGLIDDARPQVEYAAGVARDRATEAAVAARPHIERAAKVARERAIEAAVAARPHIERAAEVARERAAEAAVAARPHVEEAVDTARPVVADAVQRVSERTAQAFESTLEGGPTIVVKRS